MKKRTLSFLLALIMCLSLLPMTALAADVEDVTDIKAVGDTVMFGSLYGKEIKWTVLDYDQSAGKALLLPLELIGYWPYNEKDEEVVWEKSTIRTWLNNDFLSTAFSDSERSAILDTTVTNSANSEYGTGAGGNTVDRVFLLSEEEAARYFSDNEQRQAKYLLDDAQTNALAQAMAARGANWSYSINLREALEELSSYYGYTDWWWLRTSGNNEHRANSMVVNYDGEIDTWGREINEPFGGLRPALWVSTKASTIGNASDWATEELQQADELGLIPDILQGADLTKPITRKEFAAVCVKTYEALSSKAALPIVNNPFTDCNDVEVLKAYNIGAVKGTSATTYEPDALLNREQMATMLTRVFKAVTLTGWTLETDGQFTLPYTKPAAFADDKDISGWAKDSVYFMAANKIIAGVGGNKFAPKNTTTAQAAQGYANATREQALVIAVRMVNNLGK